MSFLQEDFSIKIRIKIKSKADSRCGSWISVCYRNIKRLRFLRNCYIVLRRCSRFACVMIYLFLMLAHVICYAAFDSVYRIQKVADRVIMIQRINDQCDIFAHIAADVVWLLKKLR